ncbi:MAG: glycosyltransferase [Flavobacteriales bacterium]
MKIFFLVSRIPWPLEKGDKLRAYHQLRLLAKNNEVHLCCLSDEKTHPDALSHLQEITPHVTIIRLSQIKILFRLIIAALNDKPFQVHYFYQAAAARKMRKLIYAVKPDHIYCQLVRTSEYVKHLHEFRKTIDYMDALSAGYKRRVGSSGWWLKPFVREESKRLLAYENLIYEYFDHHTIISEQDRDLIMHPGRNKIEIVPNGVDREFFKPFPHNKKYDLVFTGNMSYPPNIECAKVLVEQIMPWIWKSRPQTNLLLAGATPDAAVNELASERVHVSGWMNDIREAYASSRVFIAPMRSGSGLQNKLLEAMSMEMPSITTALASNALGFVKSDAWLVGESDEELAEMAIALLGDEIRADELGKNGRKFITDHFSWEKSDAILHLLMAK